MQDEEEHVFKKPSSIQLRRMRLKAEALKRREQAAADERAAKERQIMTNLAMAAQLARREQDRRQAQLGDTRQEPQWCPRITSVCSLQVNLTPQEIIDPVGMEESIEPPVIDEEVPEEFRMPPAVARSVAALTKQHGEQEHRLNYLNDLDWEYVPGSITILERRQDTPASPPRSRVGENMSRLIPIPKRTPLLPNELDFARLETGSRINLIGCLRHNIQNPSRADNQLVFKIRFPKAPQRLFCNMFYYRHRELVWDDRCANIIRRVQVCSGFIQCPTCGPSERATGVCTRDSATSGIVAEILLLYWPRQPNLPCYRQYGRQ